MAGVRMADRLLCSLVSLFFRRFERHGLLSKDAAFGILAVAEYWTHKKRSSNKVCMVGSGPCSPARKWTCQSRFKVWNGALFVDTPAWRAKKRLNARRQKGDIAQGFCNAAASGPGSAWRPSGNDRAICGNSIEYGPRGPVD